MKKLISINLSILIAFSFVLQSLTFTNLIHVYAVDFCGAVAYQQGDSRWGEHEWKKVGDKKIRQSVCGVLSLINAMNYKTGIFFKSNYNSRLG